MVSLHYLLKFKPLDDFFPFQNVIANLSVFAATSMCVLERIQDLTKGSSDKRPPKAVAPMASKMRFPAFSGAI